MLNLSSKKVNHLKFGTGTVLSIDDNSISVEFPEFDNVVKEFAIGTASMYLSMADSEDQEKLEAEHEAYLKKEAERLEAERLEREKRDRARQVARASEGGSKSTIFTRYAREKAKAANVEFYDESEPEFKSARDEYTARELKRPSTYIPCDRSGDASKAFFVCMGASNRVGKIYAPTHTVNKNGAHTYRAYHEVIQDMREGDIVFAYYEQSIVEVLVITTDPKYSAFSDGKDGIKYGRVVDINRDGCGLLGTAFNKDSLLPILGADDDGPMSEKKNGAKQLYATMLDDSKAKEVLRRIIDEGNPHIATLDFVKKFMG